MNEAYDNLISLMEETPPLLIWEWVKISNASFCHWQNGESLRIAISLDKHNNPNLRFPIEKFNIEYFFPECELEETIHSINRFLNLKAFL